MLREQMEIVVQVKQVSSFQYLVDENGDQHLVNVV